MMFNYYSLDIIPVLLNRFKIKNVVISGISENSCIEQIFEYCDDTNASVIFIDSKKNSEFDLINDYTLNILPDLNDYDAIFLNDDPNWFTVYNELNLIKKNNVEFPLVFICHSIFPHKYRDSYINPEIIPKEFLNEFSEELLYNGISLHDGFFHAIEENTPKNGVCTAVKDFLKENNSIGLMDIKFLNGIIILYPKNSISQIRLGLLNEEIENYRIDYKNLSDNIVENQILLDNYAKLNNSMDTHKLDDLKNELKKKNDMIRDYENKIKLHDVELNYKNSQINSFDSKLNLKESQIRNAESKLINQEDKINNLTNEIDSLKNEIFNKENEFKNKESEFNNRISFANSKIDSLEKNNSDYKKREYELNNQIDNAMNEINSLKDDWNLKNDEFNSQLKFNQLKLQDKENQLKLKNDELNENKHYLNSIKHQYQSQHSKLDNKNYCISCFKQEISNNHLEIEYLKKDTLTRKIFSPLSYICLILKSKPKELFLNFKLYKSLKDSKCFDIGFYLNNNKDLINSKFCKYFSPELHYVCYGFSEKRKFNKKYFNRNSKEELIDYIVKCN